MELSAKEDKELEIRLDFLISDVPNRKKRMKREKRMENREKYWSHWLWGIISGQALEDVQATRMDKLMGNSIL